MILVAALLALATGTQGDAVDPQPAKEKMICKRTVDTGSLVRGKRECRSRADWDRIAEAARAGGQDIVDRSAGGIINQ